MDGISSGSKGLAGSKEHQNNTTYDKTPSLTIWTLQNHKQIGSGDLSADVTKRMEDPQCVPCESTLTIQRNKRTWEKFRRTTTRANRRRRGVQGGGDKR